MLFLISFGWVSSGLVCTYGEPSVFALVKSYLDCRLWYWHADLLESVLLLAGFCEMFFLKPWSGSSDHPPLLSSVDIQAFFMLLSSPVLSFFSLKMYQTIDLVMYVIWFWSLTIICFTCMQSSFDCMIWVHSNSFQMQMENLESTPGLLHA